MNVEKLARFNEWWTTKNVKSSLLKPYKRPLFFKIERYLEDRQVLLIFGLRRVGKTTLMYQLIQSLLDKKINNYHIIYFSFDEEIEDFDELIKTYEEKILKKKIEDERIYILLDEIQKCKDWQVKIKIYYDLYPNLKFIISGSASVQITRKAKESLAGRIYDFLLEPLSFKEFLEWKKVKYDSRNIEISQNTITPLFYDYLRKGGFIEIADEKEDDKIWNYVKNNIIEKIIYKDIPQEFGIKDFELLKTLIYLIANQPGMIVNYDALSRDLKRSKKTIIDYFFYLEHAMLIRIVANYRKGFIISSRKLKKVYISNTAISFALTDNPFSDSFLERIAENFAVIETNAGNYFRNKYEVDIILKLKKKIIPIEVKFGKGELDSLLQFLDEFQLKKGIILTKEVFGKKRVRKNEVLLVPLWAFSITKDKILK